MKSLILIDRLYLVALSLLLLSVDVVAQRSECRSVSVDKSVQCANMIVEFRDVTSSRLRGKVDSPLNSPILVEIFKIEKGDRKASSYRLTEKMAPYTVIETNDKGDFCHSGLPDGYYVIRFGTSDGGWNCTWIKVRIVKGRLDQKIKVSLSIGI